MRLEFKFYLQSESFAVNAVEEIEAPSSQS